jgi:transcriptional regulator with XRE-family HTH domain
MTALHLRPGHIRALRKARGLTLPELAAQTRISRQTLCRWEKQPLSAFDYNLIHALAAFHGVAVGELLDGAAVTSPGSPSSFPAGRS